VVAKKGDPDVLLLRPGESSDRRAVPPFVWPFGTR
jgi:hypothetical protein